MWFKVRGELKNADNEWIPFQREIDIPGNVCEDILDAIDEGVPEAYSLEGFSWSCYD